MKRINRRFRILTGMAAAAAVLALLFSCAESSIPEDFDQSSIPGVIDLTAWDFDKGAVRLCNNLWEFYWKQLLIPADFAEDEKRPGAVYLHGTDKWNGFEIDGRTIGADGWATYRIKILMPETDVIYSFYMNNQDSAYRLWINGRELASNGIVAENRESYRAQRLPKRFEHYASTSELEMIIQIANFTHKWGGLTNSIYLGTSAQLDKFLLVQNGNTIFISSAILIMGIYHLFLAVNRRKERPSLYFAFICFAIGLWYLLSENHLINQAFPNMPLAAGIRLAYIWAYSLPPLYLLFFNSEYREGLRPFVFYISILPGAVLFLFALFSPLKIFSGAGLTIFYGEAFAVSLVIEYLLIKSVLQRRSGAALSLIGFSIYFAAVIYDIGSGLKLFTAGPLSPFFPLGMFVFIIIQSLVLAGRFTRRFDSLDDLSINLEKKVKRRTLQLIKANREKHEREKLAAIGTLVGGISHEIMNPLSGITGPASVIRREAERLGYAEGKLILKHLDYIDENSSVIIDAVQNLNALIKETEIIKKPVELRSVFEWVAKNLRRTYPEIDFLISGSSDGFVEADESILRQIINNLVLNSIAAMKGCGEIQMMFEESGGKQGEDLIIVTDKGCGMSEEVMLRAFDAFYTTRESRGGSGLGLYLVKRLTESLGWDVEIESGTGRGTVVRLIISR